MTSTTLPRFKLTPDIAAWRGGAGPSLVLIHGVGLNGDAWYAMLPELVSRFTVTVIDMPGHGESNPIRDAKQPTLDDFTSRIADALELYDGPSVVVGHSMGALVAMQLAVQVPHLVSGAVPLNSIFRRANAAAIAVKPWRVGSVKIPKVRCKSRQTDAMICCDPPRSLPMRRLIQSLRTVMVQRTKPCAKLRFQCCL